MCNMHKYYITLHEMVIVLTTTHSKHV
jgi:hypothetical protein